MIKTNIKVKGFTNSIKDKQSIKIFINYQYDHINHLIYVIPYL